MRASMALFLCSLSAGCGAPQPRMVVGAEKGAAGRIGGALLAAVLQDAGIPVTRRFGLGGPRAVHEALRAGELDVAVQCTGEALGGILEAPLERDPAKALLAVRRGYRPMGLEWLSPLGWSDPWVAVARADTARTLGLQALDQVGPVALGLRVAIDADFLARGNAYQALSWHYGLGFGAKVRVAPGAVPDALSSRRAEIGIVHALDARIPNDHLVVLADPLRWFPPCEAVPVVRTQALRRHPTARAALEALAGRVTTEAMSRAVAGLGPGGANAPALASSLMR